MFFGPHAQLSRALDSVRIDRRLSQAPCPSSALSWTIRHPSAWLCALLTCFVVCSMACEEPTFNDQELRALRTRLAPMPELDALPDDPTNAWDTDPVAAELGQKLFFDRCYSPKEVACASCHHPRKGFQWRDPGSGIVTSLGAGDEPTGNHAQTLINSAYGDGSFPNWQFWNGRRDNQWSQALIPPENPSLMGSSRGLIAFTIREHYLSDYTRVFGEFPVVLFGPRDGPPTWAHLDARPGTELWTSDSALETEKASAEEIREALTEVYVNFGKVIAAYERRIISRDSRYDRFLTEIHDGASDSDALTPAEKRGLVVFMGVGGCIGCHYGPNLTDGEFHNAGVDGGLSPDAQSGVSGRIEGFDSYAAAADFSCLGRWSDASPDQCPPPPAPGEQPNGAVKTPTLRDISKTAPYMHTGTLDTLEEVVEFYDRGGDPDGFVGERDWRVVPLNLTAGEKSDLVAFLRSLDGAPLPEALLAPPSGTCLEPRAR